MTTHDNEQRVGAVAAEFVQGGMNVFARMGLPQEALARSLVLHGIVMTIAIVGPKQVVAELREMADQIELGNMPASGSA